MEQTEANHHDEPAWLDNSSEETRAFLAALLKRIDAVRRSKGWSEGYFGKKAGGDVGVVRSLRDTGRITVKNVARIERFLTDLEGAA